MQKKSGKSPPTPSGSLVKPTTSAARSREAKTSAKPGPKRTKARTRDPRSVLYFNAKARAKRDGLPFTITQDDLTIPSHCPILGIPLAAAKGRGGADHSPSLDRIRPELGYVPSNVIVISNRANRLKSDATIKELRDIASFYATLRRGVRVSGSYKENP